MYLGLVTPYSLLPKFMAAVKNIPDVALLPLCYNSVAEAALLAKENQENVDALFFAGPSPYFLSLVSVGRNVPWFYLGLPTGGILAALLQARHHLNGAIRFSLDSIGEPEILQVLNEASLNAGQVLTCPYSPSPKFEEELVLFHSRCFHEEKVHFCLTCHNLTQIKLAEKGIPAFYISPTTHSIRDAIELTLSSLREQPGDCPQTVVALYSLAGENKEAENGKTVGEAGEFIWEYARRKQLLMVRKTRDLFQGIFSYGQFLLLSVDFSKSALMEEFNKRFPQVRLQIGYGLSTIVQTAEYRAQKAMENSRREAGRSVYLFDGRRYRQMGEKQTGEITPRLSRLAQKIQVAEGTLLRYMRAFHSMEGTFSAREFADAAGIHPKSSRKILNRFLSEGFLDTEGKRSSVSRGRPEILYRILPTYGLFASSNESG